MPLGPIQDRWNRKDGTSRPRGRSVIPKIIQTKKSGVVLEVSLPAVVFVIKMQTILMTPTE